jgi:hypothetical protein
VLVSELGPSVADNEVAIGRKGLGSRSVIAAALADVCFRGVIQTSHFNGVRTVFGRSAAKSS